ncbi:MAG: tRNA (adenosine(37)-N6)-threonylcarbamoyltransferase complex ATPase subunit type 1 TsaE [Clostridiales bacterium]|nr:tRNA (adenosine(37)-N6)-threonylcarbamoyltransferase complex ATPase subunit type 1 TsaE [Clostridiales bacterium]
MRLLSKSEKETFLIGKTLGSCLKAGDTVLLRGDLGTGKSVLARGIASSLGVDRPMASPSFTIMQPYEGVCPVYHFDLYRLSSADEIYFTGLDEHIGTDGVAMIEWPEILEEKPLIRCEIDISRGDESETRRLEVSCFGMDARSGKVFETLIPFSEASA